MQYRTFKKSDTASVVKLLNMCFPKKSITIESFNWKHFHPFFRDKTMAAVAENEKGRLVSFVCFTPITFSLDGRYQKVWACAIQATHPDFRRQGLVRTLTKQIESSIPSSEIFIGFSNTEGVSIDQFSKTIAYHIVGQFKTYYFPILFRHNSALTIKVVSAIPKTLPHSQKYNQLHHTYEYLKWRYEAHPSQTFIYATVHLRSKNLGFFVASIHAKILRIHFLTTNMESSEMRKQMLTAIQTYAFTKKCAVVAIAVLDSNLWKSSTKISISRPSALFLTIKNGPVSTHDQQNWLIFGGDVL